jgi:hypothetical protein
MADADDNTWYDGGNAFTVSADTLDGGDAFQSPEPPTSDPVDPTAPVATVILGDVAAHRGPRVPLRFGSVPAGVGALNVWRTADGRSSIVRGGVAKFSTGSAQLVDYEVPFGVPVTYRAEMFPTVAKAKAAAQGTSAGATGTLGFTGQTVVTVNEPRAWIHQPLNPSYAFSPEILLGSAETIERGSLGDVQYVEGADVASWIGGQRQGVVGLPFVLLMSMADQQMLDQALGVYGQPSQVAVLLIRTPPPVPIPRLFYGTVPKTTTSVLGAPRVGQELQVAFTSDEANPVAPGLVVTQLTRDDLDAGYLTRAAQNRAYASRVDRDSDYSLAGLAG